MGGGYYDRDVISTSSSSGYSATSNTALRKQSCLHKSLDPKRWKTQTLKSTAKNPIVFSIDVTGSMGNWSKIIYDKLPMFYGQIMMQKYLEDPSLSFGAIGDAYSDSTPIQVAEFGKGKQIDQLISKFYLEGGGGGQGSESYELTAFFYANRVQLTGAKLPFFFITGDENFYKTVNSNQVKSHLGLSLQKGNNNSYNTFKLLSRKFQGNVFLLHKYYSSNDSKIVADWGRAIGKANVIHMKEAKSVVDVTLGVIALKSGERTLEEYCNDMKKRGQTQTRITQVKNCLRTLAAKCKPRKDRHRHVKKIDAVSYGVIPCRKKNGLEAEVLLVKHKEGGHWDFVKGRGENDDGKVAAARELKEETALTIKRFLREAPFETSYQINKWEGYQINKKVLWYLCEVNDGAINLQEGEALDSKWLSVKDALELITFDTGKVLLKETAPYIGLLK